jgi:hypothetical protein
MICARDRGLEHQAKEFEDQYDIITAQHKANQNILVDFRHIDFLL